ncbi:HIT family protein [Kocuria sp. NPDC057446]|uniref:HIT family protein n=1 Tax=Kocuria sp. NPDC057446 TaxID=3346137 RepID=UPI0036930DAB
MTGTAPDAGPPHHWIRQDEFEIPGVPDSFQRLWTPHRLAYVRGEDPSVREDPGCPFCNGPERADEESLIVHRGEHCFVILNLFPYNPGHLMVCPYRHVADLTELEEAELRELTDLTRTAVATIRGVASPHAFNVGINLGAAAGGSLSGHLHQHVVPRWNGDANFMPVLAGTKAIMQTLGDTRQDIADAWPAA